METVDKEDDDYVAPFLEETAKRIRVESREVQMEAVNEEDNDDLSLSIETAVKDARAHLHRTEDKHDPTTHRARACIVCECFIQSCDSV